MHACRAQASSIDEIALFFWKRLPSRIYSRLTERRHLSSDIQAQDRIQTLRRCVRHDPVCRMSPAWHGAFVPQYARPHGVDRRGRDRSR